MGLDLTSGTLIAGRYKLTKLLGQGGMGVVWEASHALTRRSVAVKFLRGTLDSRPEMRRRFLREARAAAAVVHPNVVEVYDVFELEEDATPVMVMELLRGETFGRKLTREMTLSLRDTLEVILPVISAVGAAHSLGIVHRDLKPENVFLAEDEGRTTVKVVDFGIAKLFVGDDLRDSTLTATGTMLGTPHYMAPEQGFGERDVDHRADIWSIGAMLYEALVGGRPIEGNNLGQVLKRFLTSGIVPIDALVPDLPAEVSTLVMRMLARERGDRPADLREVRNILTNYAPVPTREFGAPAKEQSSISDPPAAPGSPAVGGRAGDTLESEPVRIEDPILAPVAGERIDTGGAHSISIVPGRSRRLSIVVSAVAAVAAGSVLWAATRPHPVHEDQRPASAASVEAMIRPSDPAPPPASIEVPAPAMPSPEGSTPAPPPSLKTRPPPAGSAPRRAAPKSSGSKSAASAEPPAPRPPSDGLYEQPPF
jgi:serine/threonine protein kinase